MKIKVVLPEEATNTIPLKNLLPSNYIGIQLTDDKRGAIFRADGRFILKTALNVFNSCMYQRFEDFDDLVEAVKSQKYEVYTFGSPKELMLWLSE